MAQNDLRNRRGEMPGMNEDEENMDEGRDLTSEVWSQSASETYDEDDEAA